MAWQLATAMQAEVRSLYAFFCRSHRSVVMVFTRTSNSLTLTRRPRFARRCMFQATSCLRGVVGPVEVGLQAHAVDGDTRLLQLLDELVDPVGLGSSSFARVVVVDQAGRPGSA